MDFRPWFVPIPVTAAVAPFRANLPGATVLTGGGTAKDTKHLQVILNKNDPTNYHQTSWVGYLHQPFLWVHVFFVHHFAWIS